MNRRCPVIVWCSLMPLAVSAAAGAQSPTANPAAASSQDRTDAPPPANPGMGIIRLRTPKNPQDAAYAPPNSRRPSGDPHNLEGVWLNTFFVTKPFTTVTGSAAPYTAEAQNTLWHRRNMVNNGTPVAEPGVLCRPPGLVRDMNEGFPFEIVQGPDKVVLIAEEGHSMRIIWLNQQHPRELTPSYLGHSVGRWEGTTLVVDTIGFNGKPWIDYAGSPGGKRLHIVERIRKVDLGGPYPDLQDLITIDDPENYTQPWTVLKTYRWRPDEMVREYNCEENIRPENMEGIQVENPALLGK